MNDELVKRLREAAIIADSGNEISESMYRDIMQAADVIEELSHDYEKLAEDFNGAVELLHKREKPHWIPATERLPESGVPTLICGDGNVVEQGFFDDEYGYWYDWGGNRTFVHHWMPLPQPPKEE